LSFFPLSPPDYFLANFIGNVNLGIIMEPGYARKPKKNSFPVIRLAPPLRLQLIFIEKLKKNIFRYKAVLIRPQIRLHF